MCRRSIKEEVGLGSLQLLHSDVIACQRCRRLRKHCSEVARTRRKAYQDQEYWGKPVPGFGDPAARLWIIGLAPGAHGANRTGRVFTGDRSGDFLFAGLHRAGFANQPTSQHRNDGLVLRDCYVSAAVHCAPPDNKPTPAEIDNCSRFLDAEWQLLKNKRCILALGGIAWKAALALARRCGATPLDRQPSFGHGMTCTLSPECCLIGCYHTSQQNTFTGRLTPDMLDSVLNQCATAIRRAPHRASRAVRR